jgi:phosphate-selective porin OprO/OprP
MHSSAVRSCCALVVAALAGAAATSAAAVEFKPTASLMADGTWIDGDTTPDEDYVRMRRARVGFDLGTKGQWLFRVEHDLTDRSAPEVSLQLTLAEGDTLWLGQFKQPFLLEDAMSDRQTPFLEPALSGAFVLSRRLGVGFQRVRNDWTWTTAALGQRLDGTQERVGVATRATRVVWRDGDAFLHLGGSAALEATEHGAFSVSSRPESYFASRTLVSTGALPGTDRVGRLGAELLWIDGPTSFQAEVAALRATRETAADFTGTTASAVVGWSPTGHARGYARGAVGSPAAAAEGGVWELFARASWIDLDDGVVRGGDAHNLSLGAVWYPMPRVRVMGNWIVANSDRRGVAYDPTVFALRLQYVY